MKIRGFASDRERNGTPIPGGDHFVEFRLNIYARRIFWLILGAELEMSKVSSSVQLNDFSRTARKLLVLVVWGEGKYNRNEGIFYRLVSNFPKIFLQFSFQKRMWRVTDIFPRLSKNSSFSLSLETNFSPKNSKNWKYISHFPVFLMKNYAIIVICRRKRRRDEVLGINKIPKKEREKERMGA